MSMCNNLILEFQACIIINKMTNNNGVLFVCAYSKQNKTKQKKTPYKTIHRHEWSITYSFAFPGVGQTSHIVSNNQPNL